MHLKLKFYSSQQQAATQTIDTSLHSSLTTGNFFSRFGKGTWLSCVCFHISVVDVSYSLRQQGIYLLLYFYSLGNIKPTFRKGAGKFSHLETLSHLRLCGMVSQYCLHFNQGIRNLLNLNNRHYNFLIATPSM